MNGKGIALKCLFALSTGVSLLLMAACLERVETSTCTTLFPPEVTEETGLLGLELNGVDKAACSTLTAQKLRPTQLTVPTIESPQRTVHSYLEIKADKKDTIIGLSQVAKAWLGQQGVAHPQGVEMWHFGDSWQSLPTRVKGEDELNVYYGSTSLGQSRLNKVLKIV